MPRLSNNSASVRGRQAISAVRSTTCCGKSNLVEALRWVMGEGSARRLRGGEMDELIFAGTGARPPRNIAEVALTIDNSARDAPFAFNDREEIEIVRRIERGSGSSYRVNGREVRARDVQLLFADAASGAHSGAMVSQGRIDALIEAKPAERRLLLEEAAGTAGLHARRRETELKLDAAAENLARLDDVVATIQAQFDNLKKQARQAQRYRRLAEQVRRAEALLFHARWRAAEAEAERCAGDLRGAEHDVAEATESGLSQRRVRESAEAALPPLRQADAAAAAELQRLTQARNSLEQELQRVLAARSEAENRSAQLVGDLQREEAHSAEAEEALARLSDERSRLATDEAEHRPARELAAASLRRAGERLTEAEAALQAKTEAVAQAEARRAAIDRRRKELAERRARLEARRAEAERQRATLAASLVAPEAVAAAAAACAQAEQQVWEWRASIEAGEAEIATRLADEQAALDAARAADARLTRLTTEAEALKALLAPAPNGNDGTPILSSLRVTPGFEAAISAAFEDELLAPIAEKGGPTAARFWIDLPGAPQGPQLPAGARSLAKAVTAPAALSRSLAQAGWVESAEEGGALQPSLAPGQRLVDREGRLWRWDGFTARAARPSSAAEHLRHKNRLAVLDGEIAAAEAERSAAQHLAAAARAQRQRATDADRAARTRLRDAEAALIRERAAEADLARRAMTTETRLAALLETLDKLHADLAETEEQAAEAERDFEELAEPASARAALDRAREQCCGTTYEASVRACEPIRSGSVRVQLVCVTHSWREPDSNSGSRGTGAGLRPCSVMTITVPRSGSGSTTRLAFSCSACHSMERMAQFGSTWLRLGSLGDRLRLDSG
jgi:chromosome segregation protein